MGKADPQALVLLSEVANPGEAAQLRAMLEAQDIACTVEGENQASILPHLAAIITPRLMVMQQDLERAKGVLAATPVLSTVPDGSSLEGAVCPVHEKQALAICARCGTFLCADCPSLGSPALCEECLGRDEEVKPTRGAQKVVATGLLAGWLLPVVIVVLLAIAVVIGRALGKL